MGSRGQSIDRRTEENLKKKTLSENKIHFKSASAAT